MTLRTRKEPLPYRTWAPFWAAGFVSGMTAGFVSGMGWSLLRLTVVAVIVSGLPQLVAHLIEKRFRREDPR